MAHDYEHYSEDAVKALIATVPAHPWNSRIYDLPKAAQSDEQIIPSDPDTLADYYAEQDATVAKLGVIDPTTDMTVAHLWMIDIEYCREIELRGLHDHETVLRLESENSILRDGMASHWQQLKELQYLHDLDLKRQREDQPDTWFTGWLWVVAIVLSTIGWYVMLGGPVLK